MIPRQVVVGVQILFLILDTIVISLRLFVRTRLNKAIGYDDYTMVMAFIGYVVLCALGFAYVAYGYGDTTPNPRYDLTKARMYYVASLLAYPIVAFFVKASVALVLYRIAAQNDQVRLIRRLLIFSIGVVGMSALAVLVGTCLQCTPLSVSWGVGKGTCVDPMKMMTLGYFWSVIDIVSVWMYAMFPIAMLWKVQMSFRMKALSSALLGLGIFASIASIIRVKYFYEVGEMRDLNDEESRGGNNIRLQIWSIVELGLAILAACLSALRPLLRFLTGRTSAHDPGSVETSGRYINMPRGHELPEVSPTAAGRWSGPSKLASSPLTEIEIDNDSQEFIIENMSNVRRHNSSERDIR